MRVQICTVLAFVSGTLAWGTLGHNTVAAVAKAHMLPQTLKWVNGLLGEDVINVANWADTYRKNPGNEYTSVFHYIDAMDSPPDSCNVAQTRDCGEEGCITSAIANYTSRLQSPMISVEERQIALRFLVHFLGDITQPLHAENLAVGGNQISVLFDGNVTNLHSAWDLAIPFIGGSTTADSDNWAKAITKKLAPGGPYAKQTPAWVSCVDPSARTAKKCAIAWAADSNKLDCSYVFNTKDSVNGTEIGGKYYAGAAPIVEQQIAKGGLRLAAWLNMIVTGKKGIKGC